MENYDRRQQEQPRLISEAKPETERITRRRLRRRRLLVGNREAPTDHSSYLSAGLLFAFVLGIFTTSTNIFAHMLSLFMLLQESYTPKMALGLHSSPPASRYLHRHLHFSHRRCFPLLQQPTEVPTSLVSTSSSSSLPSRSCRLPLHQHLHHHQQQLSTLHTWTQRPRNIKILFLKTSTSLFSHQSGQHDACLSSSRYIDSSQRLPSTARSQSTVRSPTSVMSSLARSIESSIDKALAEYNCRPDNDEGEDFGRSSTTAVYVVISVSGGCDSVALLHAFFEWWYQQQERQQQQQQQQDDEDHHYRPEIALSRVHVVHFHHRQRPDVEADGDCQLVQDLASTYGIMCHVEDWKKPEQEQEGLQPPAEQEEHKTTLNRVFSQDTARKWRRTKLFEYTQRQLELDKRDDEDDQIDSCSSKRKFSKKIGLILTAHHHEDSLESAILKLLRGVHLLNLSGIDEMTELSSDSHDSENNVLSQKSEGIFLLRPFLKHSKQDLMQYLLDRELEWREDSSNASNKYLRNRVRNELIPLLQDITDGAFVSKRLPLMMRQSDLLAADVQPRVDSYLKKRLVQLEPQYNGADSASRPCFDLTMKSDDDSSISLLIFSQAIFQWISNEMKQSGHLLGYETLERVVHQIDMYPNRLQWTLELGNGWTITREGVLLKLHERSPVLSNDERDTVGDGAQDVRPWKWATTKSDQHFQSNASHESVSLSVSADFLSSESVFFSATLALARELILGTSRTDDGNQEGRKTSTLWFTPSWRKSPIKLRQFLRGQDIPLHRRNDVQVLIVKSGNDNHKIVAVKPNEKWIVQKDFYPFPSSSSSQIVNDDEDVATSTRTAIRVWPSQPNDSEGYYKVWNEIG